MCGRVCVSITNTHTLYESHISSLLRSGWLAFRKSVHTHILNKTTMYLEYNLSHIDHEYFALSLSRYWFSNTVCMSITHRL